MRTSYFAGRVVRGKNRDESTALFAVAVDDDQGALDALRELAACKSAEVVGRLRTTTVVQLALAEGDAMQLYPRAVRLPIGAQCARDPDDPRASWQRQRILSHASLFNGA